MNGINAHTLIPPVIPLHPSSPHDNWLSAFPLRTFLELGAYQTAAGSARGHARNVLEEWRLGHLADAVVKTREQKGDGMPAVQCSCGFTEAGDESIRDHLVEVFAPDDGKAADGLVHLEGDESLFCMCGAGGSAQGLDAHFLAVFTPADSIGRDGIKHEPGTPPGRRVQSR